MLQNIIIYEWLPALLNSQIPSYKGLFSIRQRLTDIFVLNSSCYNSEH